MKNIAVGLAFAALVSVTPAVVPASAEKPSNPLPVWATRTCATDDSVNCAWDAARQGEGTGHSYIVRQVPGSAHMVCVFYVSPRYARHHDYCA